MTKVNIEEKFNTSAGVVISIKTDEIISIDDILSDDNGSTYIVIGILPNTRPTNDKKINLLVKEQD